MPKSKKKFIDKKNAVTFHLVHRSQKDPLITDENAPQHVLVQRDSVQDVKTTNSKVDDKRKKEQQKYGVFFDDEYDYLQHLREPNKIDVDWIRVEPMNDNKTKSSTTKEIDEIKNQPTLQLPSSVFPTEFEEEEGLLRKAAPRYGPRPDWDPDIVAALDDDFDYDNPNNLLDDNFMEKAMGDDIELDDNCSDIDSDFNESDYHDEDLDVLRELTGKFYNSEETKSRFTEYSMSSSVIRRNEQLALLDERFEKFYESYDEPDIGPLDLEQIEGTIELQELTNHLKEFKRDETYDKYDKTWDRERLKKINETITDDDDETNTEDLIELEIEDETQKKWDCESILSTYSNIYNHPKLIDELPSIRSKRKLDKIEINPKTGVPLNVFNGENSNLTLKALNKFNIDNSSPNEKPKSLCEQSVLSTLSILSIRPKDESAEEKRQRKHLIREYRQERRIERKANKNAFKEEKQQQELNLRNARNNQGSKIY